MEEGTQHGNKRSVPLGVTTRKQRKLQTKAERDTINWPSNKPEQTYPDSYDAFGVLGGINPKTQPSQNPESVLTFGREFQRGFGPQNPTPQKYESVMTFWREFQRVLVEVDKILLIL